MKLPIWFTRIVSVLAVLAVVGIADAGNVPAGVTGLWRFQTAADRLKATVGVDLVNSYPGNAGWMSGPWTVIEPGLSDNGIVQDWSWEYLTADPNFRANGGGSYVNKYTVAWDVKPDPGWNSLYQTSWDAHAGDGDLWINAATQTAATIGVGGDEGVGYSTLTFDATKWHRIVLTVDNGNFFRVYVDGTLFVDAPGRSIDGRFSLYVDRFHLFADNNWEDAWILCGMVATWNRALTSEEVAGMGGWIGGASTPTALVIPETPPPVQLALDIKPEDCPNSFVANKQSKGRIPVAVLGSADFDVTTIDVDSISIDGVAYPVKMPSVDDVSGPGAEVCACGSGPDGYPDLILHFSQRDVIEALALDTLTAGAVVEVTVTGVLPEGQPFEATDCVVIEGLAD